MKSSILLTVGILLLGISTGSSEPEFSFRDTSQVTLGLAEFESLSRSARDAGRSDHAGPELTLGSANYTVDFSSTPIVVRAVWTVENFTDEARLIPFSTTSLALAHDVPVEESGWVVSEKGIGVVMEGRGRRTVAATFVPTKTSDGGAGESFGFPILPAAVLSISVRGLPPERAVRVVGGSMVSGNSSEPRFSLPPSAKEVVLVVSSDQAGQESRWEWRSEAVVRSDDVGLNVRVRVVADNVSGSLERMLLPMPARVRGLKVVSDGLEAWAWKSSDSTQPVLDLQWIGGDSPRRIIELDYSVAIPFDAEDWPIEVPAPSGPDAVNLVTVLHPENALISAENAVPDRDVVRVSDWMRSMTANRPGTLIQSATASSVSVEWLPVAEPEELIVRSATFTTQIVQDGSTLTDAVFEIEPGGGLQWNFSLPNSARLLRCTVNGKSIRPVSRGDVLEVAMPRESSSRSVTVGFSFTDKVPALDAVSGAIEVRLPLTPTFIHTLVWCLGFPDSYELAGIESNAEVVATTQTGSVELERRLTHGSPVIAQVHYRKRGLQD